MGKNNNFLGLDPKKKINIVKKIFQNEFLTPEAHRLQFKKFLEDNPKMEYKKSINESEDQNQHTYYMTHKEIAKFVKAEREKSKKYKSERKQLKIIATPDSEPEDDKDVSEMPKELFKRRKSRSMHPHYSMEEMDLLKSGEALEKKIESKEGTSKIRLLNNGKIKEIVKMKNGGGYLKTIQQKQKSELRKMKSFERRMPESFKDGEKYEKFNIRRFRSYKKQALMSQIKRNHEKRDEMIDNMLDNDFERIYQKSEGYNFFIKKPKLSKRMSKKSSKYLTPTAVGGFGGAHPSDPVFHDFTAFKKMALDEIDRAYNSSFVDKPSRNPESFAEEISEAAFTKDSFLGAGGPQKVTFGLFGLMPGSVHNTTSKEKIKEIQKRLRRKQSIRISQNDGQGLLAGGDAVKSFYAQDETERKHKKAVMLSTSIFGKGLFDNKLSERNLKKAYLDMDDGEKGKSAQDVQRMRRNWVKQKILEIFNRGIENGKDFLFIINKVDDFLNKKGQDMANLWSHVPVQVENELSRNVEKPGLQYTETLREAFLWELKAILDKAENELFAPKKDSFDDGEVVHPQVYVDKNKVIIENIQKIGGGLKKKLDLIQHFYGAAADGGKRADRKTRNLLIAIKQDDFDAVEKLLRDNRELALYHDSVSLFG